MKYTRHIGYGILFGASVIMAANIDIQAEENEQIPIPVEEQAIVENTIVEEPLMEETVDENTEIEETVDQEIEETEAVNEPVLTAEQAVVNNGIPVIYLHIDESQGTIEAMNSDSKHNTYCYGTMDFKLPSEDFKYADLNTELKDYYDLDMQIKGRGNSTWTMDKKPYKIKLDKKTDLLGQGKDERNKHWVLIANSLDVTLIKDRLTGYVGEQYGMEFTPIGVPVDVVMNDKYLGSYLLMEHIRVGTGRIDIEELSAEDVDPSVITGGYFVRFGHQSSPEAVSYFTTKSGTSWVNHTPNFDVNDGGYENDAQKNYIRNYMQMIEDILYSDTQSDDKGNPYSYYMDLPSAAKYWLVQAVSKNTDAYRTGSTYLYKRRDTEDGIGKLYWGPLWDFDLGWGIHIQDHEQAAEGIEDNIREWIIPMIHDTDEGSFYQQIQKEWPGLKSLLLDAIKENGIIDKYYQETKASKEADIKVHSPQSKLDYPAQIAKLKGWIVRRINWMDENLSTINNYSRKVKIVDEGQQDVVYYLKDKSELSNIKTPSKEGYVFLGWMKEDGSLVPSKISVTEDMVLIPKWVSIEEASKYEQVIFRQDVVNALFEKGGTLNAYYNAFPKDAEYKKISWESSNPSVATVDENGKASFVQPGTTTISAVLSDGSRWSYVLNLLEKRVAPTEITVPESMTIQLGEHRRIDVTVTPDNAGVDMLLYNLKDASILDLEYLSGTVTGKEIGTTTVTVYIWATDPVTDKRITFEKVCTITVVEKKEDIPEGDLPSEVAENVVNTTLPSAQTQVKGVPTGVHINTRFWLGSLSLVAIGVVLSTYRRLLKK